MTNKRILASVLSLAICASSAFSLIAATAENKDDTTETASASVMMPEEEIVKPSAIEQARIDALLKEHGWDKLGLSFAKADYYSVFTDEDKAEIESNAKKLSLRGAIDATTMYIAHANVEVKDGEYPYQLRVVVFSDLRTGMVNAAEIIAYPYPLYEQGAKVYALNTKQSVIDKAMGDYMKQKIYQPGKEEHRAAKILGYQVSSKATSAVRAYFKENGWDLSKRTIYQNPPAIVPSKVTPAYNPFLTDAEISSAMTASANGGPQVMMMMGGSGFYFAEVPYRFKGTDNYFYIAYCAMGGDIEGENYHPTFSWIMMRPAVYNMDGAFDKFFYPVDTDLKTILADATNYFKTNKSAPDGAVN